MPIPTEILVPIIVAIVAGLPGIISIVSLSKRNRAEAGKLSASAADLISQASVRLTEVYEQRVGELEGKIDLLHLDNKRFHLEVRALRDGIATLIRQLKEQDLVPIWTPEEIDLENGGFTSLHHN